MDHNKNQTNKSGNLNVSSHQPTYTSCIYITAEKPPEKTTIHISPVLSMHRVNGIEDDNKIKIRKKEEENSLYITTVAVHRHSDTSSERSDFVRQNLNFVSI